MRLRTTIGDTEKHEIEVVQGWLGKRKVIVDGDDIVDKWAFISLSEKMRFTVGEQEKHEVRVRLGRGIFGIKIGIYVDGRLAARS